MGQISDRFLGGVCFIFGFSGFSSNQIHQSRISKTFRRPWPQTKVAHSASHGPPHKPVAGAIGMCISVVKTKADLGVGDGVTVESTRKNAKVFGDGLKGKNIQVRDSCYWVFFNENIWGKTGLFIFDDDDDDDDDDLEAIYKHVKP